MKHKFALIGLFALYGCAAFPRHSTQQAGALPSLCNKGPLSTLLFQKFAQGHGYETPAYGVIQAASESDGTRVYETKFLDICAIEEQAQHAPPGFNGIRESSDDLGGSVCIVTNENFIPEDGVVCPDDEDNDTPAHHALTVCDQATIDGVAMFNAPKTELVRVFTPAGGPVTIMNNGGELHTAKPFLIVSHDLQAPDDLYVAENAVQSVKPDIRIPDKGLTMCVIP